LSGGGGGRPQEVVFVELSVVLKKNKKKNKKKNNKKKNKKKNNTALIR
jgi:hypothetical protein